MRFCIFALLFLRLGTIPAAQSLVVSANENKIDLVTGAPRVIESASPDTLTIIDFSWTPPTVRSLSNIPNSVIGPPSNVAVSRDETFALVASSVRIDPSDPAAFIPDTRVFLIRLDTEQPYALTSVSVGPQPSGLAIHPNGKLALVANRAGGSLSVLDIKGRTLKVRETLQLGGPTDQICDVAIASGGHLAMATNQTTRQVRLLSLRDDTVVDTGQNLTGYGDLYHCEITPDGTLGLAAGGGEGQGAGAITVFDLQAQPPRVVQVAMLGTGPESFDISPDGKRVAAVLMNGSNLAPQDPAKSDQGQVVLLELRRRRLEWVQTLPTGAIPEGVTFSPNGTQLIVQAHPDRQLIVYDLTDGLLVDNGQRIAVPGMPSAIRTAEVPIHTP